MTETAAQPTDQMPVDNPDLTSTIPMQNMPESVDVNTPQPGQMPMADTPAYTPTIPSETAPNNPDIERQYHEAWWRRTLDKVGTILGGDQTVHITKDKDGNVTLTHDPSTTGEKWGRVAAAALGGAAAGLANSQGPAGLAKATGAGIQTGMQQPQQREQNAQEQVDFDNKQMMAKANRIHLTQQSVLIGQQAKLAGLQIDQQTADTANKELQTLSDSPGAEIIGTVDTGDPNGVLNAAKQNPRAMDAFLGKGDKVLRMVPIGDHKLQMVMVNKTWEEQKNTEPRQAFYEDTDDNGNLVMKSKTLLPGANTNGSINNSNTAAWNTHLAHLKTKADADKAENDANKTPATSMLQMEAELNDPRTTPERKAQINSTLNAEQKRQIQLRQASRAATGLGSGGGSVTPKTPQETEQFLKSLPAGDSAQVRAIGEIRNQPPSRYSKEGSRLMSLVDQAYPGYDSTQYPAYLKTKLDYAPSGASGKGLNFIGTALAHMDRMEANVDALRNVSIPVVGSWWNAAKNAAQKGTSPAIAAFVNDQKAVTNEIARAYNGGAITQGERDHMMELISASDSPETIKGSLQEFRELLHGKLDQYQIGWDAQMPRHQRNAVLDNLSARGTAYRPPAAQQPQPGTPPPPTNQPNLKPGAPIFDAATYTQKHPGKDVNDAIKRAQANGMNVINAPQQ